MDYLTIIEDYIHQLDVTYKKEILVNGRLSYQFDDFSAGLIYIVVTQDGNKITGLSIRGLHAEINDLIKLADKTNLLLNIPIKNYMIMDKDKMTPLIIAVV